MAVLSSIDGQWAAVQTPTEVAHDQQVRGKRLYLLPIIDAEGIDRESVANPVQFDNHPPDLRRGPTIR